jgi:iron complex transport system ATP-binding protein
MKQTDPQAFELIELQLGYRGTSSGTLVLTDRLSLKAGSHEIIGLIGRNGCGKSSLLRTLVRLQPPLNGKIYIHGKDVRQITPTEYARMVGFVSTENPSIPHMSVGELVALGRFPHTNWMGALSTIDKQAVSSAMERAGITQFRKKYLHELSDGERQKCMIARVLAQDTPIVVLDEPTAFLDLPNRYELLRLLNEIAHQNNKTIIYSTHDLNIALHESDKIWLMANGTITEGAPEDLIITKGFHKLFENSDLDFDMHTAVFRLKRNYTRQISLKGDAVLNNWTSRALERIGIQAVDKILNGDGITTCFKNDRPCWTLRLGDRIIDFKTVYDLINTLKMKEKLT